MSHQRQAFGQRTLLRSQPKRALRARCQKSRAVRAGLRLRLPFDGTNVLFGRAVAMVDVLGAHTVAILGDFSSDPVGSGERANDVTHQLRLADAAGVSANYDYAPA